MNDECKTASPVRARPWECRGDFGRQLPLPMCVVYGVDKRLRLHALARLLAIDAFQNDRSGGIGGGDGGALPIDGAGGEGEEAEGGDEELDGSRDSGVFGDIAKRSKGDRDEPLLPVGEVSAVGLVNGEEGKGCQSGSEKGGAVVLHSEG